MNKTRSKNRRSGWQEQGFTLVEVVLVMVVTAIVFISIYGLYSNTVKQDMETRYEIMASNLAQEGVEIIRNERDRDQLRDFPINHSFPHPTNDCYPFFDGTNGDCDGNSTGQIRYDGSKYVRCGIGGCGAGETPFSRSCDVICNDWDSGDCIRMTVTCTVSWPSFVNPALNREVEAVSILTSWQE